MKNFFYLFMILIGLGCSCIGQVYQIKNAPKDGANLSVRIDDKELLAFRKFADSFFLAVKKSDTIFLKKHILFPIKNSSFGNFNSKIKDNTKIDSKLFFKNLSKFFPKELLKFAEEGECFIDGDTESTREYFISHSRDVDGITATCTWIFVKRMHVFYFQNFLAEAG